MGKNIVQKILDAHIVEVIPLTVDLSEKERGIMLAGGKINFIKNK